ncbi:radical SAM/SPASM domain-containing protein [Lachnoanaerobaculum orale]|uniref:radical SAM/SPASM domain-containing protein n=1 Tax=Lachnoanaerobaculum orale TaxID=979627 RepID=UPI0023A7D92B|nr:radical SAM protein [Lachnoanaerobaculum orale]
MGNICTIINGKFSWIEVKKSSKWIKTYPLYINRLVGNLSGFTLVICSARDLIDIIPNEYIKEDGGEIYTVLEDRYSENFNLLEQTNKQKEMLLLKEKEITVFSICPTYSCNMACKYCFESGYNTKKDIISDYNLSRVFNSIENDIGLLRRDNKSHNIRIELFGGEPLQSSTFSVVEKVFYFARKMGCDISIVTNGFALKEYLKLFLLFKSSIAEITVTLDGPENIHNDMRQSKNRKDNPFKVISDNVDLFLKLDFPINIATNMNKSNIEYLDVLFQYYNDMGWVNYNNFSSVIGRVYNRMSKGDDKSLLDEVDILTHIIGIFGESDFPKWLRLGFLKTIEHLSKKMNLSFGQNEYGRFPLEYCWSSSEIISGYYVDPKLNTYRCTCTVGLERYSLGNIRDVNSKSYRYANEWSGNKLFNDYKCRNCNIGGYCCGGCVLEREAKGEKFCDNERNIFKKFVKTIVLPRVYENVRLC